MQGQESASLNLTPDKELKSRIASTCGDSHSTGNCKAYGKTCRKCHKQNHFAKVCMSRPEESHQHLTKRKTGKEKHLENNWGDGDIPEDLSSDESLYVVN